jgi:hypothetical protein
MCGLFTELVDTGKTILMVTQRARTTTGRIRPSPHEPAHEIVAAQPTAMPDHRFNSRLPAVEPFSVHPQRLLNLGVDSLMAVEIGNQIQAMAGVEVPAMKFMEGLSIAGLSMYVIEQLSGDEAPAAVPQSAQQTTEQVLEQVEQLSDEEVDALLHEKLPVRSARTRTHEPTAS